MSGVLHSSAKIGSWWPTDKRSARTTNTGNENATIPTSDVFGFNLDVLHYPPTPVSAVMQMSGTAAYR